MSQESELFAPEFLYNNPRFARIIYGEDLINDELKKKTKELFNKFPKLIFKVRGYILKNYFE